MSSTLNKLKEKITGDSSSTTGSTATGNTGTGSSTAPDSYEQSSGTGNTGSGHNTRSGQHTAYEEAPVVKERYHDQTQHVDQTERHEVHEQDKVNTVIQPVKDEESRGTQHHRVDEGVNVHEHGSSGLDDNAEAELRRRRDEIARQGGTEYSESHSHRDERPDVHVHDRTNTIEQVQPVIEKDIYQGHRVDHDKKEVDIHHEPTKVGGTQVAPTVSVDEYNRQR